MEKTNRLETAVLLLDHYDVKADLLRQSLRSAGFSGPVVVLADDGFLPDDVIGLFHWFIRDERDKNGHARYFDQIDLPDYWQISGNNRSGEIHDMDIKRGAILYSDRNPEQPRLVREVRWNDRSGKVKFADYYDRFGELYGRMTYDKNEQPFQMSWFDRNGREILTENEKTRDIILNREDGKMQIFQSITAFALFFLQEYERKHGIRITDLYYNSLSWPFFVSLDRKAERNRGDLLFWQEGPRPDVPGNMQVILSGQTHTKQILVQDHASYENLIKAGADKDMLAPLGFVYPYTRKNGHGRDVLICTNSDQIAHIHDLVQRFPRLHFHIAAVTEMSQKLLDVGQYANVSLYPNIPMTTARELFGKCDYYLDINYGGEILDAVRAAFLSNELILGFEATAHNRTFTADEHLFSDYDKLAAYLEHVLTGENLDRALAVQKKAAMDEPADAYRAVIRL